MMQPNPYQPPSAYAQSPYGAAPLGQPGPPRLFTPNAVALATFLGTPLAGALLYASNLRKLGRAQAAAAAAGVGVLVTAVILALAFALPDSATGGMTFVNLGLVAGGRALAEREFGPPIAAAGTYGVAPRSSWWAAGAALLVVVPLAVLGIAYFIVTETKVTIAEGQTVVYQGDATERDAKAVGADLVHLGVFGPKAPGEKEAILSKKGDVFSVSFYVGEGAWNEAGTRKGFLCIGSYLRGHALGKSTTRVLLLDSLAQEKSNVFAPLEGEPDHVAQCGSASP